MYYSYLSSQAGDTPEFSTQSFKWFNNLFRATLNKGWYPSLPTSKTSP